MSDSRNVVRYLLSGSSEVRVRPSLKTVMGTILFRNVVCPACRQIPDCPSLLSLHGRAGLYLLEYIIDSLYAFITRVYLNLCVPIRAFGFPDGSNILSTQYCTLKSASI